MKSLIVSLALLTAACGLPPAPAPAAKAPSFTIDDLLDIKHPSSPVWSPDGASVVFVWDRAGVSNLYVAGLDGSTPRALTSEPQGVGATPFFGPDSGTVYFPKAGDLWAV
ncbi:MAG: hypothetical protein OEW19_04135, partial [Acidobacteriota bacterium]|nr:hypothetical protein [Acidobacteriota bacterium]